MSSTNVNVTGRKPEADGHFPPAAIGHNGGPTTIEPEELIDEAETAALLRQKPQTLAAWRCDNRGPEYVKVGRRVFYRRSSISAFLAACIVSPRAK